MVPPMIALMNPSMYFVTPHSTPTGVVHVVFGRKSTSEEIIAEINVAVGKYRAQSNNAASNVQNVAAAVGHAPLGNDVAVAPENVEDEDDDDIDEPVLQVNERLQLANALQAMIDELEPAVDDHHALHIQQQAQVQPQVPNLEHRDIFAEAADAVVNDQLQAMAMANAAGGARQRQRTIVQHEEKVSAASQPTEPSAAKMSMDKKLAELKEKAAKKRAQRKAEEEQAKKESELKRREYVKSQEKMKDMVAQKQVRSPL